MSSSITIIFSRLSLNKFLVNIDENGINLQRFCRNSVNDFSILDLKAFYGGFRYVDEFIKLLRPKTRTNFNFSESSGKHWGNPSYFS